MRYFQILVDEKNPQPNFLNWYQVLKPGKWQDEDVYQSLKKNNHFKIEYQREVAFLDILSHPQFMVSKEFMAVFHMYDPHLAFKNIILFDQKTKKTALYQLPHLPVVDCLAEESRLNLDKSRIITGVLSAEKMKGHPLFRLGGVNSRCILTNLEVIESAYRRKVTGMKIREFIVR